MSPRSQQTLTRGQVRHYVFWGSLAAFVVALAIGLAAQAQTVDDLRDGCARANPRNELLQTNTELDSQARRSAAPGLPERQQRLALYRNANKLEDALQRATIANAEVATALGAITANCEKAYPKPWPFSIFD